jgi:intracellular multiplication protein IcmB
MGILDPLVKLMSISRKQYTRNYFDLDHNCHENILVTDTGGMLSVIKLNGLLAYPGDAEWKATADHLLNGLKSIFKSEGQTLQWVFERDSSKSRDSLLQITAPALRTMKSQQLDFTDIYNENIDVNESLISHEESYVAIWTDYRLLEANLYKARKVENATKASALNLYLAEAPNIFSVVNELKVKHLSVIEDFLYTMQQAKLNCSLLTGEDACSKMALSFNHSLPKSWVPRLIGINRYLKTNNDGEQNEDGSDLFWTKISEQIGNTAFSFPKPGVVKINNSMFRSGEIKDYPISIKPFRTLVDSLDRDVPYRISFKIASGKGFDWGFRTALNGFVAFAHSDNGKVRDEMELLESNHELNPMLRISTTFTTWSDDMDKLDYNFSRLEQAIQSWGICDTVLDKTDEMEMLIDTVIGANPRTPATQTYAPVSDIIKMLPIDRTASLWDSGFLLFRTKQDVVFPWTPVSPITKPSIELYIARSRMGKSVLSNSVAAALVLDAGGAEMPYICTTDVGSSSVGVYNLIRDRLPADKKHLVVTYMLNLDSDDYINPFQKSACMAQLFEYQRSFVSGLLMLLAQDSRGGMHVNMQGFIDALITEVYVYKNEVGANKYSKGILTKVDEWVDETQFALYPDTSWFEIEQGLGLDNKWFLAEQCAVYSSPILQDFITVANSSSSLDRLYNKDGGSSVIDEFVLRMTETSKKYRLLTSFSSVNFSQARLRSIDLQNVISKDENFGPRQNGIMFMLALYLGSGDFFLNKDCLRQVPDVYLAHYRNEVRRIRSVPCRLFMDEFHQSSGLTQTVTNVERYMREGGKWGINSALASQNHNDFTAVMIGQATSYFFLGGVARDTAEIYRQKFSLSNTDVKVLVDNTVHGPKRGGSSLLYVYKTNDGQFSQVLKFPVGSQLLWANSTNIDDLNIKEEMTNAVGSKLMLKYLARYYPSGTIENEVQKRKKDYAQDDGEQIEDDGSTHVSTICSEILRKVKQSKTRAV